MSDRGAQAVDASDPASPESPPVFNPLEQWMAPLVELASSAKNGDEPAAPASLAATGEPANAAGPQSAGPAPIERIEQTEPGQPIAPSALSPEPQSQAMAAADTDTQPGKSIDLLQLVDPLRHAMGRPWTRDGTALVSPRTFRAILRIPTEPPSAYRWTIVAERIAGNHSLNLLITVGGRQTMVVLDGFGNHSSGLNLLDGRSADCNESTRLGTVFTSNTPCTIVCVVGPSSVLVTCDGHTIVRWNGSPSQLSTDRRIWIGLERAGLALAVYQMDTQFRITQMELTPLDTATAERLYAQAPPPVGRKPSPGELANAGGARSDRLLPPWERELPTHPGRPMPPPIPVPPAEPSREMEDSTPLQSPAAPASQLAQPGPPPEPIEPSEAALQRKGSVCLIEHPFATGTGFVAGENLVATNAHVIQDAYPEEIELGFSSGGGAKYRASKLLYKDSLRDLCLLEVYLDRPPIPIVADHALQRGEKVVIIGNPALGETDVVLRDAVATGTIHALVHAQGCDFYQVNATINYGSSGGPVLNFDGQVVGVVAMKATERGEMEIHRALGELDRSFSAHFRPAGTRGIAFAIPVGELNKALETVRTQSQSAVEQVNDRHTAEVAFERLSVLGGLHLLQLYANVPRAVRQQAEQMRFRHIPAATLRQMKLVELLPEDRAHALAMVLGSEEVRKVTRDCERRLAEKVEHVRQSQHLEETTRIALESLLRAVTKTKEHTENPPTTYQTFSRAISDRENELKKLINQLSDQLAITDPAYSK